MSGVLSMLHRSNQKKRQTRKLACQDEGMTFIEVLVSVVLLGTAGLAVLAALQVSVLGSRIERDHARAQQWLQSAGAALDNTLYQPCSATPEDVRQAYENAIRASTVGPPGWDPAAISVVSPVRIWDGNFYLDPYAQLAAGDPTCFAPDYNLHLITIQVRNPDGDIIETTQYVKNDRVVGTP